MVLVVWYGVVVVSSVLTLPSADVVTVLLWSALEGGDCGERRRQSVFGGIDVTPIQIIQFNVMFTHLL